LDWQATWAWSLPLIAINVVIHVLCLGLATKMAEHVLRTRQRRRGFVSMFSPVMSVIVTLATLLHCLEAAIWAVAYRLLDALPDNRSAMLYSLSAMTSYGHANFYLEEKWQLMGALEALNGMLLFGLTTAFLFAMIQRVWVKYGAGEHR
jgi:hypothetical protein